jgi:hypothetical protein
MYPKKRIALHLHDTKNHMYNTYISCKITKESQTPWILHLHIIIENLMPSFTIM